MGIGIFKKCHPSELQLFSDMAPTYMKIYDANKLKEGGTKQTIPVKHQIVNFLPRGISAFHLMVYRQFTRSSEKRIFTIYDDTMVCPPEPSKRDQCPYGIAASAESYFFL